MDENSPIDEKLPYQTRPLFFSNGASVDEFIIPDEDRELVLEQLYPFSPIPKLTFVVKDFRVTWEHGMNYLVSPYYPESGGTVIDWVDEDWANEEDDTEEFDDDLDADSKDDELPF